MWVNGSDSYESSSSSAAQENQFSYVQFERGLHAVLNNSVEQGLNSVSNFLTVRMSNQTKRWLSIWTSNSWTGSHYAIRCLGSPHFSLHQHESWQVVKVLDYRPRLRGPGFQPHHSNRVFFHLVSTQCYPKKWVWSAKLVFIILSSLQWIMAFCCAHTHWVRSPSKLNISPTSHHRKDVLPDLGGPSSTNFKYLRAIDLCSSKACLYALKCFWFQL